MRLESRGNTRQHKVKCALGEPKLGTELRKVYDIFQANKGIILTMKVDHRLVEKFRDEYGMDIKCLKKQVGGSKWMLAGQITNNCEYIDYFAQRVDAP